MFNLETKSERPEIFLRPKESVNVPFVFVSMRADHSVQPQVNFKLNYFFRYLRECVEKLNFLNSVRNNVKYITCFAPQFATGTE